MNRGLFFGILLALSYTVARPRKKGGPPTGSPAFTLLEVVLVLALLTLAVGFFAAALPRLQEAYAAPAPETLLRQALLRARTEAFRRATPVFLTLDNREHRFRLSTAEGTLIAELGASPEKASSPTLWTFHAVLPSEGESPAGAPEAAPEAQQSLVFHPSGVSTHAIATAERDREERRWQLDPFSASLLPLP